jgi:uncharacterized membrane protein (DUF373 family)
MKPEEQSKAVLWMAKLYGWLNILIAYILLLTGFLLTIYTCADVLLEFQAGKDVMDITITLVHHLLLIMIILEILWTLKNYIRTQKLSVEAFIIIAIISSVRKILVVGASVSMADPAHSDYLLSPLMADVMTEAIVIFLMVVAIYVLRKSRALIQGLDEE